MAAAVATRCDLRGLILLEAAIGSRTFLQERGVQTVVPTGETLDLRFTSVDEYLRRWRAENPRYSDEAERWIDRFARFELAPLRMARSGDGACGRVCTPSSHPWWRAIRNHMSLIRDPEPELIETVKQFVRLCDRRVLT